MPRSIVMGYPKSSCNLGKELIEGQAVKLQIFFINFKHSYLVIYKAIKTEKTFINSQMDIGQIFIVENKNKKQKFDCHSML